MRAALREKFEERRVREQWDIARRAQGREHRGIRGAHAEIAVCEPEAEVEQRTVAVLRPQGLAIGTQVGTARCPGHAPLGLRQAQRDAVQPQVASRAEKLVRECAAMLVQPDRDGSPGGHHLELPRVGRFGGPAMEFRDRTERTDAPAAFRRSQMAGDEFAQIAHAFAQYNMPTTEPATQVASVPDTMVFPPSETTSSGDSGAMVPSPPIIIPRLPKLAKPHSA